MSHGPEQRVDEGTMTGHGLRSRPARRGNAPVGLRIACGVGLLGVLSMPFHAQSPWVGQPAEHLSPLHRAVFERGLTLFQTVFTPSTGLGPAFNAVSCASCHQAPVVGGSGGTESKRVTAMLASGRHAWVYVHARGAPDGP